MCRYANAVHAHSHCVYIKIWTESRDLRRFFCNLLFRVMRDERVRKKRNRMKKSAQRERSDIASESMSYHRFLRLGSSPWFHIKMEWDAYALNVHNDIDFDSHTCTFIHILPFVYAWLGWAPLFVILMDSRNCCLFGYSYCDWCDAMQRNICSNEIRSSMRKKNSYTFWDEIRWNRWFVKWIKYERQSNAGFSTKCHTKDKTQHRNTRTTGISLAKSNL